MHGESNGNRIFVYGTLRRGFPLHRHLASMKPRFLGRGTVRARLYDLGEYPGAVKSTDSAERITGELYELSNPFEQLRELDALEEFDPANPAKSLFIRRSVMVRMSEGRQSKAWVYFLNKKPPRARVLRRGDYTLSRRSAARTTARRT